MLNAKGVYLILLSVFNGTILKTCR